MGRGGESSLHGMVCWRTHGGLSQRVLTITASMHHLTVHPGVTVGRSGPMAESLCWIFVVDFQAGVVCDVPDISKLVVHIPHVVFDVDGDARRLQHLHGELLREGTNKQSSDCVDAGDLIRHADLFGLVPVLQVQHT